MDMLTYYGHIKNQNENDYFDCVSLTNLTFYLSLVDLYYKE